MVQRETVFFMRVHDQNLTGTSAASAGAAAEAQRAGRATAGQVSATARFDRVELSGAVGTISRALTADSASRAGRVQQLAAQYQSGRYQPDAASTSRAMISDALASAVA